MKLSSETERVVAALFAPEIRAEVSDVLIQEVGNHLPFLDGLDEVRLERFRYAVLKLSSGDMEKFRKAVALAKQDWRDLLVAARFANDLQGHKKWAASLMP